MTEVKAHVDLGKAGRGWGSRGRQEVWGQTRSHTTTHAPKHVCLGLPGSSGKESASVQVQGDVGVIPSHGAEIPYRPWVN